MKSLFCVLMLMCWQVQWASAQETLTAENSNPSPLTEAEKKLQQIAKLGYPEIPQTFLGSSEKLITTMKILSKQQAGKKRARGLQRVVTSSFRELDQEVGFRVPRGSGYRSPAHQTRLINGHCRRVRYGKKGRKYKWRRICTRPNPNAAPLEFAVHTTGYAQDIPYKRLPKKRLERLVAVLEQWDAQGKTITTFEFLAQKCLHVVVLPQVLSVPWYEHELYKQATQPP